MKDKNIDIENRIAKAKTTDELLALAAEIGEPLTLEQAEKLLAEIKVESQTAEQSFASEEDIPDAELDAVAGGFDNRRIEEDTDFALFTYRDGGNVLINFNGKNARCQKWACKSDFSTNRLLKARNNGSCMMTCSICQTHAICRDCAYRSGQGWFYHDFCTNPEVRRYHGL